jgi:purine-binding chemotaxis protein CheW
VTDIIEIPELTFVPKLPDYIKGLMNHRGRAIPVIDFRKRMGFADTVYSQRSCVIVVEVEGLQAGIIVDMVSDVEDILPQMIARSPISGGTVKFFITANKKRISLLDPGKLVRERR